MTTIASLLLSVVIAFEVGNSLSPRAREIARKLLFYERASEVDINVVDAQSRTEVINLLRTSALVDGASFEHRSIGDMDAQILLLRLGDEQMAQHLVTTYHRDYETRASDAIIRVFELAHEPIIIKLLSKDLFIDEPLKYKVFGNSWEGYGVPPRSEMAGTIINRIIIGSPHFSSAMKEWAEKMEHLADQKLYLKVMRRWWTDNESYFKAGNYTAVHPVAIESPAPPASTPTATPPAWPPWTPSPTSMPVSPQPRASPSPQPAVSRTQGGFLPMTAVALLTVAGFVGYLLFANRRKQ